MQTKEEIKRKIYKKKQKKSLSPGNHKNSRETTPIKHIIPFRNPNFNFDNFFNQSMTLE